MPPKRHARPRSNTPRVKTPTPEIDAPSILEPEPEIDAPSIPEVEPEPELEPELEPEPEIDASSSNDGKFSALFNQLASVGSFDIEEKITQKAPGMRYSQIEKFRRENLMNQLMNELDDINRRIEEIKQMPCFIELRELIQVKIRNNELGDLYAKLYIINESSHPNPDTHPKSEVSFIGNMLKHYEMHAAGLPPPHDYLSSIFKMGANGYLNRKSINSMDGDVYVGRGRGRAPHAGRLFSEEELMEKYCSITRSELFFKKAMLTIMEKIKEWNGSEFPFSEVCELADKFNFLCYFIKPAVVSEESEPIGRKPVRGELFTREELTSHDPDMEGGFSDTLLLSPAEHHLEKHGYLTREFRQLRMPAVYRDQFELILRDVKKKNASIHSFKRDTLRFMESLRPEKIRRFMESSKKMEELRNISELVPSLFETFPFLLNRLFYLPRNTRMTIDEREITTEDIMQISATSYLQPLRDKIREFRDNNATWFLLLTREHTFLPGIYGGCSHRVCLNGTVGAGLITELIINGQCLDKFFSHKFDYTQSRLSRCIQCLSGQIKNKEYKTKKKTKRKNTKRKNTKRNTKRKNNKRKKSKKKNNKNKRKN